MDLIALLCQTKQKDMTKLESIKAEILTLKIKEIASETDEKYQEIERELSSKNYTFYFRMECLFSNFGGEVHFVKVERLDILEIGAEEGIIELLREDLWAVEGMIIDRYNAEL